MAASPVLADSTFYIQMLRSGRDPLRSLALAAATRDVAICGVVRSEVARGIVRCDVLQRFQAAWDVMIHVATDNHLWEDVEGLAWRLDRAGTILPLTDLIIACCARRIDAVVLTFDHHFQQIPKVRAVDRLDA